MCTSPAVHLHEVRLDVVAVGSFLVSEEAEVPRARFGWRTGPVVVATS